MSYKYLIEGINICTAKNHKTLYQKQLRQQKFLLKVKIGKRIKDMLAVTLMIIIYLQIFQDVKKH